MVLVMRFIGLGKGWCEGGLGWVVGCIGGREVSMRGLKIVSLYMDVSDIEMKTK